MGHIDDESGLIAMVAYIMAQSQAVDARETNPNAKSKTVAKRYLDKVERYLRNAAKVLKGKHSKMLALRTDGIDRYTEVANALNELLGILSEHGYDDSRDTTE